MSHAILNTRMVVKATQAIYGKCKTNTVLNSRVMGYVFTDTITATYLEGHVASSPHQYWHRLMPAHRVVPVCVRMVTESDWSSTNTRFTAVQDRRNLSGILAFFQCSFYLKILFRSFHI